MLVNNQLAPQWSRLMSIAAQERLQQFPGLVFDPMHEAAQAYIRQRSAEFVTMVTNEQRMAIRAMVEQAAGFDALTADALAQVIRPTIGLTPRQSVANMRYWNVAWQSGVENGLSSRAAERRANQMAATYAARQHRYRAMNIARTELATAYNEGAFTATIAAQEQGFLGDVTKTWLTAEDERVCPICVPLDGVTVNMNAFFPNITAKMPPAHPMCRCAVAFMEVAPNLQPNTSGSIMASGGVGDTDGYTVITDVRQIDFNDESAVMAEIEQFGNNYAYSDVEHAVVITPVGNVYILRGNEVTVNPSIIGHTELGGSILAHNHPVEHGFSMGDSFSRDDFVFSAEHGLRRQYLFSGERRNSFELTRPFTASEAYDVWHGATVTLRQSRVNRIDMTFRQEEVLKILSATTEGVVFYVEF